MYSDALMYSDMYPDVSSAVCDSVAAMNVRSVAAAMSSATMSSATMSSAAMSFGHRVGQDCKCSRYCGNKSEIP